MTEQQLKNIRGIKFEIAQMESRLASVERAIARYSTHAVVTGSSAEPPYNKHAIHISGVMPKHAAKSAQLVQEAKELQRVILRLQLKSLRQQREALQFIETIPDSQTRQMIALHYLDGLSWQKVAERMGETDESYPRRKCKAYLRSIAKNTGKMCSN